MNELNFHLFRVIFLFFFKKRSTLTRIVGYCASSTKCSDHGLKNTKQKVFFLNFLSFFSACYKNT